MNIIFQIDGGLGKSIMGTAIVKVIKKHYPTDKIIVVTAYTDVFLNNPHIEEVIHTEKAQGIYLKYIKDQKSKIFVSDPYHHYSFQGQEKHLYKIWCDTFDLEYNGESPEFYLTQPEIDYFKPFYNLDKPIMVIHPNGGPINQGYTYSWPRDIPTPTMDNIINEFKDKYAIVQIRRKDQHEYKGIFSALDGFRSIAILLQLSEKRLLIDSFSQHLAASLSLPSTVCWVTTNPGIFGYEIHDNIIANKFTKEPNLQNAVYQPFNFAEDIHSIPYNNLNEVFDTNKIIESINK
jgi:hypothetical protein